MNQKCKSLFGATLNFQYKKLESDKFEVYFQGESLGNIRREDDKWIAEDVREIGKSYKSRRASSMRLLVLSMKYKYS